MLCIQSLAVGQTAYNCAWYERSTHFRRLLLTVLTRAQKPSYITLGKLIPLSIALFTLVSTSICEINNSLYVRVYMTAVREVTVSTSKNSIGFQSFICFLYKFYRKKGLLISVSIIEFVIFLYRFWIRRTSSTQSCLNYTNLNGNEYHCALYALKRVTRLCVSGNGLEFCSEIELWKIYTFSWDIF